MDSREEGYTLPSGRPSRGSLAWILPRPLRIGILITLSLVFGLYLMLVLGILSPLAGILISSIASTDTSSVAVYGLRSDLFWKTSADSVVVRDQTGLRVFVGNADIEGSVFSYLNEDHVNSIEIDILEIHLADSLADDEHSTLSRILSDIDEGIVVGVDRLLLHYGRITDFEGVLLDSMSIDAFIVRGAGVEVNASSAVVDIRDFGTIRGNGRVSLIDNSVICSGFTAEAPPGSLTVSGTLRGSDGSGEVILSGIARTWTADLPLQGEIALSGRISGTLENPEASIHVESGYASFAGIRYLLSADSIRVDMDRLSLENFVVENDMFTGSLYGTLDFAELTWNGGLYMGLRRTDLSEFFEGLPSTVISGSFSAVFSGDGNGPRGGTLNASLEACSIDTLRLSRGSVTVELGDGRASIISLLNTPYGSVELDGFCTLGEGWQPVSYSGKLTLALEQSFDLLENFSHIFGSIKGLDAVLEITGTRRGCTVDGTLELEALDLENTAVRGVRWEGTARVSDSGVDAAGTLSADSLLFAGMVLGIEADVSLTGEKLTCPQIRLEDSSGANLTASAEATLSEDPVFSLRDIEVGVGSKLQIFDAGELRIGLSDDTLFLDTLWLELPVGLITASGIFGPPGELNAGIRVENVDFSSLRTLLSIPEDISGIGSISISAESRNGELSARISGIVKAPSYGEWSRSDSVTVALSVGNSDLDIEGLYIWTDGERSGLQARIDDVWTDGELSIKPQNLAWLEVELNNLGDWLFYLLPLPIKTSGASVSARIEYARGNGSPSQLHAYVSARIDRLFITTLGIELPNVSFYFYYPDTTTTRYTARGLLSSGSEGTGSLSAQMLINIIRDLPRVDVGEYQLNASFDRWQTVLADYGQLEITGHLQSSGSDLSERPEINGQIDVVQGILSITESSGTEGSGDSGGLMPFDVHIEVTSDRGVWFRNSMANIELSADLRILTQSRQLTVSGMIQTVRGKVRLLQKEFDITHGTVEIRQGIPPEIHLDVHASTTIRGAMDGENYMIDITLTGDPVNPEMILSGTGPAGALSQEDVLSLLAVGLTYGELQQMDSATLEAELESVAQVYVGQLLASHIRDGIGLDALNITPQLFSDSTALTVNVGKYVLPDLYVSYTGDVFSSQPGMISAQYYISRDFSVLGTTKSTLNGDQEPSIELHYTLRY